MAVGRLNSKKKELDISSFFLFLLSMKAPSPKACIARMPLLRIAIPFVCGIVAARQVDLPPMFLLGAFALCAAAALLLRSGVYLLSAAVFCGMSLAAFHDRRAAPLTAPTQVCELEIDRVSRHTATGRLTARYSEERQRWESCRHALLLRTDSTLQLRSGERITAFAALAPLRPRQSPYLSRLHRSGIRTFTSLSDRDIISRHPPRLSPLRRTVLRHLQRLGIDGHAGSVGKALAAADRIGLPSDLTRAYAHSGMSHLLALSGLHIAMLFLMLNIATRWLALFRHGQLLRGAAAVGLMWLYVVAAGAPPSAVRAAVMCSLLQCSLLRSSSTDGLNTLAAAALVLLMWNPAAVNDLGFQLSFTAVAAIIVCHPSLPVRRRFTPLAAVGDMMAVGLTASLATAPLIAHTFGYLPLWGVLLNPLVIPLTAVVLAAVGVWFLLPFPPLAALLRGVADHAAAQLNHLADATAQLPLSTLDVRLTWGQTVALYLFLGGMMLCKWYFDAKKKLPLHL